MAELKRKTRKCKGGILREVLAKSDIKLSKKRQDQIIKYVSTKVEKVIDESIHLLYSSGRVCLKPFHVNMAILRDCGEINVHDQKTAFNDINKTIDAQLLKILSFEDINSQLTGWKLLGDIKAKRKRGKSRKNIYTPKLYYNLDRLIIMSQLQMYMKFIINDIIESYDDEKEDFEDFLHRRNQSKDCLEYCDKHSKKKK
jgi:hypothetical protein